MMLWLDACSKQELFCRFCAHKLELMQHVCKQHQKDHEVQRRVLSSSREGDTEDNEGQSKHLSRRMS